jgi:hypothetical protein
MPGDNTQPRSKAAAKGQTQAEEAPKAHVETEAAAKAQTETEAAAKVQTESESTATKTVSLRHKTPYRVYRRAGLVLTQTPREYQVTQSQLTTLKADTWVEVLEG